MSIKVSVIIPVYRVDPAYLKECINSVLAQSLKEIEIILVDDGAPQENADLLDGYAQSDGRVSVIRQENKGASAARNAGLSVCSGEYVTFVDSDDWIDESCLETVYDHAVKNDLNLLLWGTYKVYPNRNVEYSPFVDDIPLLDDKQKEFLELKTLAGSLPIYEYPCSIYGSGSCCSKLYKRSLLCDNDLKYPEGIERSEDVNFNIRVFDKADRIGYINRHMYYYRQVSDSATYMYRDGGIKVFTDALMKLYEFLKESGRSEYFMQVFYMRCMFLYLESMEMDYCNPSNPKPFGVRMKQMRSVLSDMPYSLAFEKLEYRYLTFAKKIPLFLIRRRWIELLVLFFKIYRKISSPA
ncbi:MAG: glycosyltransferase family 2 protein [Lachnospiraceae bacterium]|nr:glycosyltransferase family 2 protein [Lachnospiraceae bacterium]